MIVMVVLSVLIILIVSLLVFAKITLNNQKKESSYENKIEYFNGYPTTGVTYPKPLPSKLEYDNNGNVISVGGMPVKDWIDDVWR